MKMTTGFFWGRTNSGKTYKVQSCVAYLTILSHDACGFRREGAWAAVQSSKAQIT